MANEGTSIGTVGGLLAAFMSYAKWHSLFYMIVHLLCGWGYVFYYVFTYGMPKLPQ